MPFQNPQQPTIPNDSTIQKIKVSEAGTLVGTRQQLNFIEGSNITLTVVDNPGANRIDLTVAAIGGGSDALINLGSNPSSISLNPGKYLITGGSSGSLTLADSSVGDYWKIVVSDSGFTAGIIYAPSGTNFRYSGVNNTEIGYDTGTGYAVLEFWKMSATLYYVAAYKTITGVQT